MKRSITDLVFLIFLMLLFGCGGGPKYAVGCIDFKSDAKIDLHNLALNVSDSNGLEFRDMLKEGRITPRQDRAGRREYLAVDEKVRIVFLQFEFGQSSICVYEASDGIDTTRATAILEKIKHELGNRGIEFNLPETRPD